MTDARTLWSKPRLIAAHDKAEAEARFWRTKYDALTCFALSEDADSDEVREAAQRYLDALPVDHHAIRHRRELIADLDEHAARKRLEKAPDRCHKGDCLRNLDEHGRCPRHDWKQRRAEPVAS